MYTTVHAGVKKKGGVVGGENNCQTYSGVTSTNPLLNYTKARVKINW